MQPFARVVEQAAHLLFGEVFVAGGDGAGDGAMKRNRFFVVGGGAVGDADARKQSGVDDAFEGGEEVVAGGFEHGAMKAGVGDDEGIDIVAVGGGLLHLVDGVFDFAQIVGVGAAGGPAGGAGLDGGSHFGQLRERFRAGAGGLVPGEDIFVEQPPRLARLDAGADAAPHRDESFGFEDFGGFAHDGAADLEALADGVFVFDEVAGAIDAGNDASPQLARDLRRQSGRQSARAEHIVIDNLVHWEKV